MEDWAEVQRLFHREGLTKRAIARRTGMSRTTVIRLLGLREPPNYSRPARGSLVDPFADEIAKLLDTEADAPATVILERLRRSGYAGGISILKEHLARVRPAFLAARAFQRTSYLPGEIGQLDWWHTGVMVPVGEGVTREAFGLRGLLDVVGIFAVGVAWLLVGGVLGTVLVELLADTAVDASVQGLRVLGVLHGLVVLGPLLTWEWFRRRIT